MESYVGDRVGRENGAGAINQIRAEEVSVVIDDRDIGLRGRIADSDNEGGAVQR